MYLAIVGSKGMRPKNGTPMSFAMASAPPDVDPKIVVSFCLHPLVERY